MIFLRTIELSPRLMALAEQVPKGAKFADVGTDHARLPVWLLEQDVIQTAIATDLREGPLSRARKTADRYGFTPRISFRLGDGLSTLLPGDANVIAIAGMGGETIADILDGAPWTKEAGVTLLLQPMTSAFDLRRRLSQGAWSIARETLVREERTIYIILTATYVPTAPLTLAETWAGRQFKGMESPLRCEYLADMLGRAERALDGLRRSVRPSDTARRVEMEDICTQMQQLKKEWDAWQQ